MRRLVLSNSKTTGLAVQNLSPTSVKDFSRQGPQWRTWAENGTEDTGIFNVQERRIAVKTRIKYDHGYADTVAELGYPSRVTLRPWWKEYESTGEAHGLQPHLVRIALPRPHRLTGAFYVGPRL